MKQGKTLQELGRELQRQRLNRQDFLTDTRSLEMESNFYGSMLNLSLEGKSLSFTVGETAHQQIASRLNIPFRYYKKMQEEAPELLDQNVNRWLNRNPERRMIRVLDGNVRAFLSDRYRRLDNLELCAAVLPVINEMKNAGFTFSLDDYGTGYSNLTYIISMDFLNIKSDKGLLWDADKNRNSRMLLGDTIRMLRRLGVNVIQEGVETKYQLDFVLEAGANLIQGFYFSQPLRPDAFIDYVERFKGVKTEKTK